MLILSVKIILIQGITHHNDQIIKTIKAIFLQLFNLQIHSNIYNVYLFKDYKITFLFYIL